MTSVGTREPERQLKTLIRKLPDQPSGQGETTLRNEILEEIHTRLFDLEGLAGIGDVGLLARLKSALVSNGYAELHPELVEQLERHYSVMKDVHTKMAAVLDRSVGIQDVLFLVLDEWPHTETGIFHRFSPETEFDLEQIRLDKNSSSIRLEQFFDRYFEELRTSQSKDLVASMQSSFDAAMLSYTSWENRSTTLALFYDRQRGIGQCIPIAIGVEKGRGGITDANTSDPDMTRAARIALGHAFGLADASPDLFHVTWAIEEPQTYEGSSIGLAIAIGVLAELENQPVDFYTAFTGTVDVKSGQIKSVAGIPEKIAAAADLGLRRVFVPSEDVDVARRASGERIKVFGVDSVAEAWEILLEVSHDLPSATSLEAAIRRFEIECMYLDLTLVGRIEHSNFVRITVTDFRGNANLDVYTGRRGLSAVVSGCKDDSLREILQQAKVAAFGTEQSASDDRLREKYQIPTDDARRRVEERLRQLAGWKEASEKNCEYRLDFAAPGETVIVRQFGSGTLTVEQTIARTAESYLFIRLKQTIGVALGTGGLSRSIRQARVEIPSGNPESDFPDKVQPSKEGLTWIGTDESGKGDYFGPLVSAAVYVNPQTSELLRDLGVRDSKRLSDQRIHDLAREIRRICAKRFSEVAINPESYNELYEQFQREGKSLNTLLAWGHTRAIENLLPRVDTRNVIADQFGDESFILNKLLSEGRRRKLKLVQQPRAESHIAVAAASILARDRFLNWIDRTSGQYGTEIPKGASDTVVETARMIVTQHGEDELRKLAKLHFKTTRKVLA